MTAVPEICIVVGVLKSVPWKNGAKLCISPNSRLKLSGILFARRSHCCLVTGALRTELKDESERSSKGTCEAIGARVDDCRKI